MEGLVARALVGLAVLLFGRRLFWLFVGAAGVLLGVVLAPNLLGPNQPGWLALALALVLGIIGALLAVFLQRLMVLIAGFVVLGLVSLTVLPLIGVDLSNGWGVVAFIVAGIVGAIIAAATFDWALILLSSLAGGQLLATAAQGYFPLDRLATFLVLLGLFVVGVAIQSQAMRPDRPASPAPLA